MGTMKMGKSAKQVGLWIMILALFTVQSLYATPERVEFADVYRAQRFSPDIQLKGLGEKLGRQWDFSDGSNSNFTHFSGMADQKVKDGKLTFTLTDEEAVLGWGNYESAQSKEERTYLWPMQNIVQMRVKQSAQESDWYITLWREGTGATPLKNFKVNQDDSQVKGTEWQTVQFEAKNPGTDGFELKITGPQGNKIEIDWIKFLLPEVGGVFRRTFELPEDAKVWRAIGSIAIQTELFINGKKVDTGMMERQDNNSVMSLDIAPYLKTGQNTIDVKASFPRTKKVFIFFQGQVVLTTGAVINLDGMDKWQLKRQDGSWRPAQALTGEENHPPIYGKDLSLSTIGLHLRNSTIHPLIEYDGRIVYRNPDHKRLFFRSEKPVVIQVHVPQGLADQNPRISYVLRRVEYMQEHDLKKGSISKAKEDGNSLVFDVDCGMLEHAVYTIETTLTANDEVIEKRYREPFMVYGKTDQKEVAGTYYEEGIDLELEDTIDFTDPDDPHPWVDKAGEEKTKSRVAEKPLYTEPRIVTNMGLKYREVQHDNRQSFFSYKFSFKHPGEWYMFELDYPNDKDRYVGVSITNSYSSRSGGKSTSGILTDSGPCVTTGGYNPVSNKMQKLKWIHRAEEGEQTIDIVTLWEGKRPAAAGVKIYHIKGNLPAMKVNTSGERFLGLHDERPYNLGKNFGVKMPDTHFFYYIAQKIDYISFYIFRMAWFHDVAKHYVQYLRFTGQNMYVMGAYQYNNINQSYPLPNRVTDSSQAPCDIREILLAYFDANDIASMSFIEFVDNREQLSADAVSNVQVMDGKDTLMPVLKNGKQAGWLMNFIHPLVEKTFLKIVNDLAYKYSDYPGWKGVYLMPYPAAYGFGPAFCPPGAGNNPLDVGYGDATIKEFKEDTKIEVPGSGPERFAQRYDFLTTGEMREKWIDWRCRRQMEIALKARDELRKYRENLSCLMVNYLSVQRIDQWASDRDLSYHETNRLHGFDSTLYKEHDGLWYGRYMYPSNNRWASENLLGHRISSEVANDYDRDVYRFVGVRDGWLEMPIVLPENIGWPWVFNNTRCHPQNDGDNRKECFAQAMAGNDPEIMVYGFSDVGKFIGQEQQLREIIREMTPLPGQRLDLVKGTGIEKDLTIREGQANDKYYFYVVNSGFAPKEAEIVLNGNAAIYELASGKKAITSNANNGETSVSVELKPYGIKAYYSEGTNVKVASWSAK
ncbi:hypothetical protein ACFL6S_05205 [Candidatus Poribacteria bacterium]